MRNILLLGGSGFIGRNIIDKLWQEKMNLVLLTRGVDHFNHRLHVDGKMVVISGKLKNRELISNILSEHQIDTIVHLASTLIPSSTEADFHRELEEIVTPTFDVLEMASKRNIRVIYFSSGGTVYGKSNDALKESDPLQPINYYGYTKLIVENHITFLHRTKGLRYVIIRPANAYGNYQRIEAKQGFIAVALGKIVKNEPVEIWGNGQTVRDYVNVADIATVTKDLLTSDVSDGIFNVGSGRGVSLVEILALLKKYCQIEPQVVFKEKRSVDTDRIVLNIDSITRQFNFKPMPIEQGIADYIKFLGLNEK